MNPHIIQLKNSLREPQQHNRLPGILILLAADSSFKLLVLVV